MYKEIVTFSPEKFSTLFKQIIFSILCEKLMFLDQQDVMYNCAHFVLKNTCCIMQPLHLWLFQDPDSPFTSWRNSLNWIWSRIPSMIWQRRSSIPSGTGYSGSQFSVSWLLRPSCGNAVSTKHWSVEHWMTSSVSGQLRLGSEFMIFSM